MAPENGQKGTVLEPSHIQLPVRRILTAILVFSVPEPGISLFRKKGTDVQRPVGHAAGAEMQSRSDLAAQSLPAGRDVTRPEDRSVPLASCPAAPGQVDHPLFTKRHGGLILPTVRLLFRRAGQETCGAVSLPFIDRSGMIHTVSVRLLAGHDLRRCFQIFVIHLSRLRFQLPAPFRRHRLAGIAPPGVDPVPEQPFLRLLPVQLPPLLPEGVIDLAAGQQQSRLLKLPVIVTFRAHVRPDGNHEMHVFPMQRIRHGGRIGKTLRIEGFLAPQVPCPGHPVQHQRIQPDAAPAEFLRRLHKLLRRLIPLLGLDIAECPFRKHGCLSRQSTELSDHLIRAARQKIIIQIFIRFRVKIGTVLRIVKHRCSLGGQQDTIAVSGKEQRNGNLQIGLMQVLGGMPQIPYAFLRLPQSVQPLPRRKIQIQPGTTQLPVKYPVRFLNSLLDPVRRCHFLHPGVFIDHRAEGIIIFRIFALPCPFRQKRRTIRTLIADGAGVTCRDQMKLRRFQPDFPVVFRPFPVPGIRTCKGAGQIRVFRSLFLSKASVFRPGNPDRPVRLRNQTDDSGF